MWLEVDLISVWDLIYLIYFRGLTGVPGSQGPMGMRGAQGLPVSRSVYSKFKYVIIFNSNTFDFWVLTIGVKYYLSEMYYHKKIHTIVLHFRVKKDPQENPVPTVYRYEINLKLLL